VYVVATDIFAGVTIDAAHETILLALQLTVAHPFIQAHVQSHGPVQVTEVGFQVVHRFVVGTEERVAQLDPQHSQSTFLLALQLTVAHPFIQAHVQSHGPVQVTEVGFQVVHRFVVGAEERLVLSELQHAHEIISTHALIQFQAYQV
jgi:hypothetical protein